LCERGRLADSSSDVGWSTSETVRDVMEREMTEQDKRQKQTRAATIISYQHVRESPEVRLSWDVHHRRVCLYGRCGEADRSHFIPTGRVTFPIHTRPRSLNVYFLSFRSGEVGPMPTSALASGDHFLVPCFSTSLDVRSVTRKNAHRRFLSRSFIYSCNFFKFEFIV